MTPNQDQALIQAGRIIISAFPDNYGPVTFNLQGPRKKVHANVETKMAVEIGDQQVAVDMKESFQEKA
jgi:hypothetical protein